MGEQKLWKMLIILSLSSLMARLSFPVEIANHFEFIAWLRYPIIAVLLVIELYVIYHVAKSLWQARSATGDPRLTALSLEEQQQEKSSRLEKAINHSKKDSKKSVALLVATEPATWYYAIPYLSREHPKPITQVIQKSAMWWHGLLSIMGLVVGSCVGYLWSVDFSEILAIGIVSVCLYSVIFVAANYRISRYFSLYQQQDKLIINRGMWAITAINVNQIELIEPLDARHDKEVITIGTRSKANVKLTFSEPQQYYGAFGQLTEDVKQLYIAVSDPEKFIKYIEALTKSVHSKKD